MRGESLHLKVVHARVDAIEHSGKHAALRKRSCASLLCPVVVGHPLKKPRIGIVMASYFKVNEHAAAYKGGAMLQPFLACTRRDSERCKTETLRHL